MSGVYIKNHQLKKQTLVAVFARRELSWALLATALMSLSVFMMACGGSSELVTSQSQANDLTLSSQALVTSPEKIEGLWILKAHDSAEISHFEAFEISMGEAAGLCDSAMKFNFKEGILFQRSQTTRCLAYPTRESELLRAEFLTTLRESAEIRLVEGRLVISNDEHIFVFERQSSN